MESRKRAAPDSLSSDSYSIFTTAAPSAAASMILRPLEIPPLGREDSMGSIGSSGFPSNSSSLLGTALRRYNSTSSNASVRSDDAGSRGSQRSRSTGRSASPSLLDESDSESFYKRRKDNAFERPMLENSLESISALFSSGDFPRVAATDRDDVISIYNRRIATRTTRGGGSGGGGARKDSVASSSSSQYAMLRAWVQDDPDRVMLTFGTGITSSNTKDDQGLNRSGSEYVDQPCDTVKKDPLELQLRALMDLVLKNGNNNNSGNSNNGANGSSTVKSGSDENTGALKPSIQNLLSEHVNRGKKLRDLSRMIRAVRYARLRKQLRSKGVPASRVLDGVLRAHVVVNDGLPDASGPLATPARGDAGAVSAVSLLDLCRSVKNN